jgi:outer membrane lipoprotein SlyB
MRKQIGFSVLAAASFALTASGCAAERPVLYPNQHFNEVGASVAQADVDQCLQMASNSGVSATNRKADAANVAVNTGTGAAAGAAIGAIRGHAGRGAAAGAAGAAAGSIFRGAVRPTTNQVHRGFVAQCLHDRGYQVIGWE